MTFIEGFKQAMLEHGIPKEDIDAKIAGGSMAIPIPASILQAPIAEGTERDFIDKFKRIFQKIDAFPGGREAVRAVLVEKLTKHNTNN